MSSIPAPLDLARRLIRFDTVNPPGNEKPCARFVGEILEDAGFQVREQEFAPGRSNLAALWQGHPRRQVLCFSGHLDTVPPGRAPWKRDPLIPETEGDKLYGRGASDMKSGVAAMIVAALGIAATKPQGGGLALVFTAGEETGCLGARHLGGWEGLPGNVGALVVGEPTSNYPVVGHKGALWMEGVARGVAAHGSMPEKGVNAVYKAARAVTRLEAFSFPDPPHPVLGRPTLNVGTFSGGVNINSVPDEALVGIDVRTVPGQSHEGIREALASLVGEDMELSFLVSAGPLWTDPEHPWIQEAGSMAASVLGEPLEPRSVPYFTDASELVSLLGGPPALVLGPGEASMAHQTDEYCLVSRLEQAVEIYSRIARRWMEKR